jgi:hypothetical protein
LGIHKKVRFEIIENPGKEEKKDKKLESMRLSMVDLNKKEAIRRIGLIGRCTGFDCECGKETK